MNHTITHFEIPADEIERATEFYGKLFGWEFDNVGSDEMEYYLVKTVPINDEGRPTEQGVNGGMCKRMAPEQTPINYINIESVDEYMEKVKQLGGQVVLPKMPVPGMGWFAHCIDTEGNAFAIWEDDPSGRMNMSPNSSSEVAPASSRRPLWKYILAGLAICLVVVLWRAFSPGKTPAIDTPNGVASLEKVMLGGVEQWILIRGEDAANPVLLFLHGGPGSPVMPIAHHYGRELEKHFVVVHWDQRGGGKSYSSSLSEESFTIDQFVSDTHELTEFLRKKFEAPKIYLVGHSWGSALGVMTVQRYPDLFYAYVGMGQVVDEPRAEQIGLQFVLDKAKELGNEEALRELSDLNPPYVDNPKDVQIQRKWLSEFGGNFREGKTLPFLSDFNAEWVWLAFRSPEYSWLDLIKFQVGNPRVRWALFREFKQVNLMESAPRLEVPVYIFVGRYDYNTPVELVEEYFEMLDVPKGKHLIWFEDSGHTPFLEEPDRYAEVMVSRVLQETFYEGAAKDFENDMDHELHKLHE